MTFLRIIFPFTVKRVHPEINMSTAMERKEDLVSFSLEYDIDMSIEDAKLKSKENADGHFVYVYKFTDLNSAISFMDAKTVYAIQNRNLLDVNALEKEMDVFMSKYEAGEKGLKKKRRKMTIVAGEDGFMRYV